MNFEIKMDGNFTRKARFIARGDMIDAPTSIMHQQVSHIRVLYLVRVFEFYSFLYHYMTYMFYLLILVTLILTHLAEKRHIRFQDLSLDQSKVERS